MRITIFTIMLAAFAAISLAQNGAAIKVPALSPNAEVSQKVAITEVKLNYSRPSARGRKVFGELVPFGEVWRTGANASTKITLIEDAKIAGNDLKAGTYALYTIPGENEWTMIIHKNTKLRSLAGGGYKPENDAFRFTAKPEKTDGFVETFTVAFTDLASGSVNIALSWENTIVSFPIEFDVNALVDREIAEKLPLDQEPRARAFNLFRAAEFYLHNGRDLGKALGWIDDALAIQKEDPRLGLLKAKILHKKGDQTAALQMITTANAWAIAQKNANYTSQTQLFWDSIK